MGVEQHSKLNKKEHEREKWFTLLKASAAIKDCRRIAIRTFEHIQLTKPFLLVERWKAEAKLIPHDLTKSTEVEKSNMKIAQHLMWMRCAVKSKSAASLDVRRPPKKKLSKARQPAKSDYTSRLVASSDNKSVIIKSPWNFKLQIVQAVSPFDAQRDRSQCFSACQDTSLYFLFRLNGDILR